MFLSALFYEVKGLEPEDKYFLVRFIQHFGREEPVELGVKALAKQFGLSDRQVTASLKELDKRGVMTFLSTPAGKGRPKRSYQLTDDFHNKLNKASAQPATDHEEAVSRLLKHENRKAAQASEKAEEHNEGVDLAADARRKRQPGRLSIVNSLLLSVLLCRADRLGVVSGLGFSALCKITGLSKERLKNRVLCLIDLGLIRTYVPGATSSVLFEKMKSIYFLNLNHPELSGGDNATSVLVCTTRLDFPTRAQHADTIRRNTRQNPTTHQNYPYGEVLSLCKDQQPSFFHFLQVMLEKYAAHLLSKYWSVLVNCPSSQWIDDQELQARIRNDFRPPARLSDSGDDCLKVFGRDRCGILVDELYHGAYSLAIWITELFDQVSGVPFGAMDFVIIPRLLRSGYFLLTLLALPRSSDGWRGGVVIEPNADNRVEPQFFPCESDIPLEDRYRFGLLTRPGSKVKNP